MDVDSSDFRLSNRPVRPPGNLPWYRRFARQIALSVAGSMIAGMLINATSLVFVVRCGSAAVTRFLGDPFSGTKGLMHDLEDKAHKTTTSPPASTGSSGGPISFNPLRPSPAELEARERHKQADRDRKEAEQRQKFIARADAVGLKHDDSWTLDDFKVRVPKAEEDFKEAEERKPLLAEARELKMVVDPDWDNKTLKAEILEEKRFQRDDSAYQEQLRRYQEALRHRQELIAHGPNTRCPTPKCGYGFHTNRTKGTYICPKCRNLYPITQARACYTPPPMPQEPFPPQRKPPGFFKRTFG